MALLALCEGNPPGTGGFPSQRASKVEFNFSLAVGLNKLLKKWLISHQFEMPHPQGGVFCPMISIHHKITLAIRDSDSLQPCLFYVDSLSIQCQHITHPQLTFVAVLSEMGWHEEDRSLNWQQIRYPHRFSVNIFISRVICKKMKWLIEDSVHWYEDVFYSSALFLGNITTYWVCYTFILDDIMKGSL